MKTKSSTTNKITAISLFSGAGGMDFGATGAGIKTIWSNELVPVYCSTLRRNFPDMEIVEGDIAGINKFPKVDLVYGGYPCQSFSMGGKRNPRGDHRTSLYQHFARVLNIVSPSYFIAENVSGLKKVQGGIFLKEQLDAFESAGPFGYRITAQVLDAKDYGVPQTRKRVLIVGVRKDLGTVYVFPKPSHGINKKKIGNLKPYVSFGETIRDLPLWPEGEFYNRPHDPDHGFSWYYMSRNRKADWDGPSYTIVANWRHTPLHPASPTMKLTWSDLANGWKQRWDFTKEYEHLAKDPTRPRLETPRRLSWRECARIQTFPDTFQFEGTVMEKFEQIGNAVPTLLFETVARNLTNGEGLVDHQLVREDGVVVPLQEPLFYNLG